MKNNSNTLTLRLIPYWDVSAIHVIKGNPILMSAQAYCNNKTYLDTNLGFWTYDSIFEKFEVLEIT